MIRVGERKICRADALTCAPVELNRGKVVKSKVSPKEYELKLIRVAVSTVHTALDATKKSQPKVHKDHTTNVRPSVED